MENILLALNTNYNSESAFEFACYLSHVTKAKITNVVFENAAADKVQHIACAACAEKEKEMASSHPRIDTKTILNLRNKCIDKGLNYSYPYEHAIHANELIKESRFADVMLIDGAKLFEQGCKGAAMTFIKNILAHAECPVIMTAAAVQNIEEIVFLYDGTNSSANAIKQFTYLVPQFHNKKTSILQIGEEPHQREEDRYKFKEWLKTLYIDLHFEIANEDKLKKIYEAMFIKKNRLLVSGIDNSQMLRFLKHKTATGKGVTLEHPLFLTHQ